MPVRGHRMSECPFCSLDTNAACHLRISADIGSVVEVYELVSESLTENDPNNRHERRANRDESEGANRAIAHKNIERVFIPIVRVKGKKSPLPESTGSWQLVCFLSKGRAKFAAR